MQHLLPSNHGWPTAGSHNNRLGPRDARIRQWNGKSVAALAVAYENHKYRQFFHRYQVAEIMRGYELAQDEDLFRIVRQYRNVDIRLLLKFVEEGALDFFEALKGFRGSDILECREAIVGNPDGMSTHQVPVSDNSRTPQSDQLSNTLRDSGYGSRPSSEVRSSVGSSILSYDSTASVQSQSNFSSSHNPSFERSIPVDTALTSVFSSQYLPESHCHQHSSSPSIPQTPYDPSTESSVSSPLETAKSSQPRLFECMYCAQDFVRYGDCLNHEKNNHSQKKEWICPHCKVHFKTKGGYDRHHKKTHGCQQCMEPERVVILSGPKTACACPFCGLLLEGPTCFLSRAKHIETTHYKGEPRKTKADMNHSCMVKSLLSRQGLSGPWKLFIEDKPEIVLTWTAENARLLLDDLEFGDYPKGIHYQTQRIYELADKLYLSSDDLPGKKGGLDRPNEGTSESPTDPFGKFIRSETGFSHPSGGVVLADEDGEPMDFIPEDCHIESPALHATSTGLRTKQLLNASLPIADKDICDPTRLSESSRGKSSKVELVAQCPSSLRDDVFMGSGRITSYSQDTMDFSSDKSNGGPQTARDPTPPSQSWNFGDIDDPLIRMEDIMTQHILSSSQPTNNAATYMSSAWEDALPPSLRTLASSTPPPPVGPLPWHPQRRSPRMDLSREQFDQTVPTRPS